MACLYSSRPMYILTNGERVLGRVIFKISVGFVTGALILLAGSLYLSNQFIKDHLRPEGQPGRFRFRLTSKVVVALR